jgi:uncharacterized membrane protein (UPF0127 family)
MKLVTIKIKGKAYKVKDCRGFASVKGLMFDKIDKYDGALIYANNIWMPFVKHKLDLFFLDNKMKVIEKKTAVPMTLNPKTWKTYSSKKAKYCLEIKN